ncbi:MAG: hypothetical protein ABI723_14130 [Bacteroidia bacterium]
MSTAEIRKVLHEAIENADETQLYDLQELVNEMFSAKDGWDTLSPEIQNTIEKGLKDVAEGRVYKHRDVMKALRKDFYK